MSRTKPKEANERHAVARSTSPADARSYYGRPIIKPPIWDRGIAVYFFLGGMAGGSSLIARHARAAGNDQLARAATLASAVGVTISPGLLIRDLGRPERFANMLRVVKPTSPMNVGSWVLAVEGTFTGLAAVCELTGRLPRIRNAAERGAAMTAPVLATYTGVLVADTAVPVWHEARFELPLLFASGGASSAGAASMLLAPASACGPARRVALMGSIAEEAVSKLMEWRLGELGAPLHEGPAGGDSRAATRLTVTGGVIIAAAGTRRWPARLGAALTLAGALCRRMSVYHAGFESAIDPKYTADPQRRRANDRGGSASDGSPVGNGHRKGRLDELLATARRVPSLAFRSPSHR